jgi:hypothetical protein
MTAPTITAPVQGAVRNIVHSYLFQRRGIGILGVALPVVLFLGYGLTSGHLALRNSISSYYYTDMRNYFVGSMCAIGVFLICYRYDRLDDMLSNVAGVLAIAVALCPTAPANPTHSALLASRAHAICAGGLFLLLAAFCFVIFTRTDPGGTAPTSRKLTRNALYRACGVVILVCVVVAGLTVTPWVPESFLDRTNVLFWAESVAILAFGLSWLVKGETILAD